ncbi:hypothetical protein MMC29_003776 [Sticta canariensis]|nr:hypothetical protein [Sticta canariensis]
MSTSESHTQALEFEKSTWSNSSVSDESLYTVPEDAPKAPPGTLLKAEKDVDTSKYTLPPATACHTIGQLRTFSSQGSGTGRGAQKRTDESQERANEVQEQADEVQEWVDEVQERADKVQARQQDQAQQSTVEYQWAPDAGHLDLSRHQEGTWMVLEHPDRPDGHCDAIEASGYGI